MKYVDSIIHARWIIPVEPSGTVIEDGMIAIAKGRVVAIGQREAIESQYKANSVVTRAEHLLIPGLVNAHTHAAMSLFRGFADDLPLMDWLQNHIWPAEGRWVNEEFVTDGTRLAGLEMLRCGTTCFSDMYFFPGHTARAAMDVGIRAVLGLIALEVPTAWAATSQEYLSKGIDIHNEFKNESLISTAFAPHAPYTVGDKTLERIAILAEELDIPIHMHVHETQQETEEALASSGIRPLTRLANLGLLSPRLIAVHMTALELEEIELIGAHGVHVVHCPASNLKLASGFCPVNALYNAGVNVALGTDGAASNNNLDMLSELRLASLLAKGVARSATAIPAQTALEMATINGARALGLTDDIGSLLPGKAADIVALDLSRAETQPLYHSISQLVYSSAREQVSDVWVAGEHVLAKRCATRVNEQEITEQATRWVKRIASTTTGAPTS